MSKCMSRTVDWMHSVADRFSIVTNRLEAADLSSEYGRPDFEVPRCAGKHILPEDAFQREVERLCRTWDPEDRPRTRRQRQQGFGSEELVVRDARSTSASQDTD